MSTKAKVLAALQASKGQYISGSQLAQECGVSRNSIWKAISTLQAEGIEIESLHNKGYRLNGEKITLSQASLEHWVGSDSICVKYFDCIDSTNTHAKRLAAEGAAHGTVIVAGQQTAGRGRQGRSFSSPANSGVYFSIILRPTFKLADMACITSFAAVCTAEVIEEVLGLSPQIKWVNDLFINGHKICGILTEAAVQPENGEIDYVVVGIGVDIAKPEENLDELASEVAFAPLPSGQADVDEHRTRIAALTAKRIVEECASIPSRPHLQSYRQRSLLDGKHVTVYHGADVYEADVLGINDDLTLQVRREDGCEVALSSGEVHIPSSQL